MADLTKTDIKTLRSIRNMVSKTHWTKGAFYENDANGKDLYCLVGFVNLKTGLVGEELEAASGTTEFLGEYDLNTRDFKYTAEPKSRRRLLTALEEAIREHLGRKTKLQIELFNDRRKTKREDVLAVLDLAIGDDAA